MNKKIIITLILLTLLLPQKFGSHGESVHIADNLKLLVVRDGFVNNLMLLIERTGIKNPLDKSTDRYIQNANAYGMAQRYLGNSPVDGLYLTVKKDSIAEKAGLKSGDILSQINFKQPCEFKEQNIQFNWVKLYACSSTVIIARGEKITTLSLPAGSTLGSTGLRVLTNYSPPPPRVTNQDTGLSGGLVLSLFYLDKATKGSLFSKDKVAASAQISPNSQEFSAISELRKKYLAAVESKSTLLLLADDQPLDELNTIELDKNLDIRKIKNLAEAVKTLCERGADDELCST